MPERTENPTGVLAEFATDEAIVAAAQAFARQGYRALDAFVPRPVVALEEIIAPVRSSLPRLVFFGALFGAMAGLGVQWFCNGWDLPLNVGGRPPFSLPAFIPITFEIAVLFGSVTAFLGVLYRMRLPRLYDPLFEQLGFDSASIDHFWLFVGAQDPKFSAAEVEEIMNQSGCVTLSWTRHRVAQVQEAAS